MSTWLAALYADVVYGGRHLRKHAVTSAAAILSLALAIGACTTAFRLIDALLLRPLPVTDPHQLFVVAFERRADDGKMSTWESCSYPQFVAWREAVRDSADLIAVSFAQRVDVTYSSEQAMEPAYVQHVTGGAFDSLGLRPAWGRVFTERDDDTPGAHPVAVLSYDYWTSRFARDPGVLERTLKIRDRSLTIVGVAPRGFTGTEPGTATDIFLPTMMNPGSVRATNAFWLRTFVRPKPGRAIEPLRDRLHAVYRAFEQERLKGLKNFPPERLARALDHAFLLTPAATGVSNLQKQYRVALAALCVLVALVLAIACANLANLMAVRAAARARELALRVSLGASRARLVQLIVAESLWIAGAAAAIGTLFAWWAAPFIVSTISPRYDPTRLSLPLDWRVAAFVVVLTFGVTLLFALAPALRARGVTPALALKGADDQRTRRHLMPALVAMQVAFCFVVHFIGGLFVVTYDRLATMPTGYVGEGVLALETVTSAPQAPAFWDEVSAALRATPGVEGVAQTDWPLVSGTMSNNFISIDGAPPSDVLTYFLRISPDWRAVMTIPLINGRDIQSTDTHPGVAVVNETFAARYFGGENPVGKSFETLDPRGPRTRFHIVGLVGDASYRSTREPMLPVAYVPFHAVDRDRGVVQARAHGHFLVRTASADPLLLAPTLRQVVSRTHPSFRVSTVRTQTEIDRSHTLRERLLATLAVFFALVALLLAVVGLYGVLHHAVLQRRREIGIRIALGAQAAHVVRHIMTDAAVMVLAGALVGVGLGLAIERYVESLLYEVSGADPLMLAVPTLTIVVATLLAALSPTLRAVRIDPVATLRAD